ncbi:MAG: hypothetical protein QME51_03515, partial [Planctomycetota bacterium]|nr:hypothetical protein [Planctomycetota bacterium]
SLVETGRPLDGYKTGRGKMRKGLPSLGMMALTGDKELLKYLKKEDEIDPAPARRGWVEGDLVCAVKPDKLRGFRKLLRNKLVSAGSWIIKTNYSEKIIRMMNERINKLVNKHRAEGIAPFTPNGPSYVNFAVVETDDPSNPNKKIKRLILDIQVSTIILTNKRR